MAKVIIPKAGLWKVTVTEYERGWGQNVLRTEYWDSEQEAKDACHEVNKRNTAKSAPDYYIQADYHRV